VQESFGVNEYLVKAKRGFELDADGRRSDQTISPRLSIRLYTYVGQGDQTTNPGLKCIDLSRHVYDISINRYLSIHSGSKRGWVAKRSNNQSSSFYSSIYI